jgi:hypothetical protein
VSPAGVIAAEPPDGASTVTNTDPVDGANADPARYATVMVSSPGSRRLPGTVMLAVALPPLSDSAALPRTFSPKLNATVPVGNAVPLAALTVALRVVDPLINRIAGLAEAVTLVEITPGPEGPAVQFLNRLLISIEPRPVVSS